MASSFNCENPFPLSSPVDEQNPMHIALKLSKRLMGVVKVKHVLHIEAGLEMIALAMAISLEVSLILSLFNSY
jgi:hypothetical protein